MILVEPPLAVISAFLFVVLIAGIITTPLWAEPTFNFLRKKFYSTKIKVTNGPDFSKAVRLSDKWFQIGDRRWLVSEDSTIHTLYGSSLDHTHGESYGKIIAISEDGSLVQESYPTRWRIQTSIEKDKYGTIVSRRTSWSDKSENHMRAFNEGDMIAKVLCDEYNALTIAIKNKKFINEIKSAPPTPAIIQAGRLSLTDKK